MSLNQRQWDLISHSVSSKRHTELVQQQGIFRVFQALAQRDDDLLQKLLAHGVQLDSALEKTGDTAAPHAAHYFPDEYPFTQITPMGWAAFTDDVDALMKLYQYGADPSFPGPGGRDPLWMAALSRSIHSWDWLKEKISPNMSTGSWQLRANDGARTNRLMEAVVRRSLHAVRDIVPHVDIAAVDNTGKTALHLNLLQDPYTDVDMQIARLLIEYGSPVGAEDHEGVTVASLASSPEQQALMDRAVLAEITAEAHQRAEAQRAHRAAINPTPPNPDPTEPGFPQIQKPVRFKKPFM